MVIVIVHKILGFDLVRNFQVSVCLRCSKGKKKFN